MAVHRLTLDLPLEDDYELIAIHSSMEAYKLAFLLNKNLGLRFYRKKDVGLLFHGNNADFQLYEYEDTYHYSSYYLLKNKTNIATTLASGVQDLFTTTQDKDTIQYAIPELKKVDYFLKVETETDHSISISMLSKLKGIDQIIAAYAVEYDTLKSKNNLIFE